MGDFGLALQDIRAGKSMSRADWPEDVYIFLDSHPLLRNVHLRGRPISPAVCKVEQDGTVSVGWSPDISDMLAEDWFVYLTK